MSLELAKRRAAERALAYIEPGMRLGLGTGSTAAAFIDLLGARVRKGLKLVAVPTSEATHALAQHQGIPLATLEEVPRLDLTIDGADEIDPRLHLIKGGGGALLREKIVATASRRMIVIADHTKKVATLGRFPLPVEVVRFGHQSTELHIVERAARIGAVCKVSLRRCADELPFVTDGGNLVLDCAFGRIDDPPRLAEAIQSIPGVVEHGLFLGLAELAIVAGPDGVEILTAG
jgi:ribose 5-phosphate isomerase A